jgi:hypothetical protein
MPTVMLERTESLALAVNTQELHPPAVQTRRNARQFGDVEQTLEETILGESALQTLRKDERFYRSCFNGLLYEIQLCFDDDGHPVYVTLVILCQ